MPARSHGTTTDLGLLAIRVMLAVVFIFHGSQKLFGAFEGPGIEGFAGYLDQQNVPMPTVGAWLASLAEFVGGLALLTGFLMRLLILPTIFTMGVAVYKVHWGAFSAPEGMEFPLTLGVVMLGLVLTGAGRFALRLPTKTAHD